MRHASLSVLWRTFLEWTADVSARTFAASAFSFLAFLCLRRNSRSLTSVSSAAFGNFLLTERRGGADLVTTLAPRDPLLNLLARFRRDRRVWNISESLRSLELFR